MKTLTELVKEHGDRDMQDMRLANIDDIFRLLLRHDISEVQVTKDQMAIITLFIVGNLCDYRHGTEKDKNMLKSTGLMEGTEGLTNYELLREGKVDKFLGINLTIF